jgi:hypothetical protein
MSTFADRCQIKKNLVAGWVCSSDTVASMCENMLKLIEAAKAPVQEDTRFTLDESASSFAGRDARMMASALAPHFADTIGVQRSGTYFPLLFRRDELEEEDEEAAAAAGGRTQVPSSHTPPSLDSSNVESDLESSRLKPVAGWLNHPGQTKKGQLYWLPENLPLPTLVSLLARVTPERVIEVVYTSADGHTTHHSGLADVAAVRCLAAELLFNPCIGHALRRAASTVDSLGPDELRLVCRRIELRFADAMRESADDLQGGKLVPHYPDGRLAYQRGGSDAVTFRDVDCAGLAVSGGRCGKCANIRTRLAQRIERVVRAERAGSCHVNTPHGAIAASPRKAKIVIRALADELKGLQRAVRSFKKLLDDDGRDEVVAVRDAEQAFKVAILLKEANESSAALDAVLAPGTKERAVWDDQQENVDRMVRSGGCKSGFRYSGTTIRLGLALLVKCGKSTYDDLRSIFMLPTARHLQGFKGNPTSTGVLEANLPQFRAKVASTVATLRSKGIVVTEEAENAVYISVDAMVTKAGVIWSPHNGMIIGFSDMSLDLDVIGQEFVRRVHDAEDVAEAAGAPLQVGGIPVPGKARPEEGARVEFANNLLVWYATSAACPGVSFPIARFAMTSVTSADMLNTWTDVSDSMSLNDFDIALVVADGASENRAWFDVLATHSLDNIMNEENPDDIEFLRDLTEANVDTSFKIAFKTVGSDHWTFIMSDP